MKQLPVSNWSFAMEVALKSLSSLSSYQQRRRYSMAGGKDCEALNTKKNNTQLFFFLHPSSFLRKRAQSRHTHRERQIYVQEKKEWVLSLSLVLILEASPEFPEEERKRSARWNWRPINSTSPPNKVTITKRTS